MSTKRSAMDKMYREIARCVGRKVMVDLKENLIGGKEDEREARELIEFHVRRELARYDVVVPITMELAEIGAALAKPAENLPYGGNASEATAEPLKIPKECQLPEANSAQLDEADKRAVLAGEKQPLCQDELDAVKGTI